ncbi:MAG: RNA polymerase sigma-54 factor [Planctomycetes bacterium]|nr:RNA polymerase sigma-54 factor [Planctomycetota bacterium]
MGIDMRMHQKLELGLRLAPQMIQSIELLQLPALDLNDAIEQELDVNEFLERVAPTEKTGDDSTERERDAAEEERYERMDIWDDAETRRSRSRGDEGTDIKMEAMYNAPNIAPGLQESLRRQYALLEVDARFDELAEAIIGNITDDGLLSCGLEELLLPHADKFSLEDAARILSCVQRLEPRGIGARNKSECWLLQILKDDPDALALRTMVLDHFEHIEKNRVSKIALLMQITVQEVERLTERLRGFSLHPGRSVGGEVNHYIKPDVIIEWNGSGYDLRLADDWVPELRLSNAWKLALTARDTPQEYREYVRRKVDSARSFIMAVERRKQTLMNVAQCIVKHQRDYLDHGMQFIRPLKMLDVAGELGIHVSTVSRASSEKYFQSHRGLIAMKDLFTTAARSTSGSNTKSRDSVLLKVRDMVAAEDAQQPLDDNDIVQRLKRDHGVDVARRSVTKYRNALGIPSSRQRKRFGGGK